MGSHGIPGAVGAAPGAIGTRPERPGGDRGPRKCPIIASTEPPECEIRPLGAVEDDAEATASGDLPCPRRRGHRLPSLKAMATARRRWDPLPLTLYGRPVTPLVFGLTALWYGALREQPVRILVVRDPRGRRRDEAFFCTDLTRGAAAILETYARRWTLEVTFHDQKQFLGFEDPQNQTPEAVTRTAPMAGIAYDLVLLWYAARVQEGLATGWTVRPWYRSKATPSFLDMLTAVRQESWRLYFSDPPLPGQAALNPAHSWPNHVLATA